MRIGDGLLAGAAGTLALNAVTYADMAIRARPPSRTPEETVRKLAERVHLDLGSPERAANRRAGLGPLLGYATGLGITAGLGAVAERLPVPAGAGLLTAAAMVATSGPMTALGVTDPRRWSRADWISDLVPHLAYGVVGAAVLRRLRRR